jgi:excisionase family DNA binding protein
MGFIDRRRDAAHLVSSDDREAARHAQRCLRETLQRPGACTLTLRGGDGRERSFDVPAAALELLEQTLAAMGEGRVAMVASTRRELSVQDAARYLNVSRAFVVGEIATGRLPHRAIGTQRRVAFEDLEAYVASMCDRERVAVEGIVEYTRELGLGG